MHPIVHCSFHVSNPSSPFPCMIRHSHITMPAATNADQAFAQVPKVFAPSPIISRFERALSLASTRCSHMGSCIQARDLEEPWQASDLPSSPASSSPCSRWPLISTKSEMTRLVLYTDPELIIQLPISRSRASFANDFEVSTSPNSTSTS